MPPRDEDETVTHASVVVTLPADANQVDETGNVWAFLPDAGDPTRIWPGAIIVSGDPVEPFLAQVVDVVDGPRDEGSSTSTCSVRPTRSSTSCGTPDSCYVGSGPDHAGPPRRRRTTPGAPWLVASCRPA